MLARVRNMRVGVLMGGASSERPISLRTGTAIADALAAAGLTVQAIDIGTNARSALRTHPIDIAFIALHGKGGEDGVIQRLLEGMKIPYTGSGPAASRVAFDKVQTKRVLEHAGIPTPRYAVLTKHNWRQRAAAFTFPVVIKPLDNGSSIGVFVVASLSELQTKLKRIFANNRRYLLEEYIAGREVTVGIVGRTVLPVIELRPTNAFYDFEAKYTKGKTDYLVPAPLPTALYRRCQRLAMQTFTALGTRDMGRVDLMIDAAGNAFVLELNSIPGFTATSLLPKAAQHAGIDFTALCMRLLSCAAARGSYGKKAKKK